VQKDRAVAAEVFVAAEKSVATNTAPTTAQTTIAGKTKQYNVSVQVISSKANKKNVGHYYYIPPIADAFPVLEFLLLVHFFGQWSFVQWQLQFPCAQRFSFCLFWMVLEANQHRWLIFWQAHEPFWWPCFASPKTFWNLDYDQ
jgi:hypothetical protein